eukprot:gene17107-20377_t
MTSDANDSMQVWIEAKTPVFFEDAHISSLNNNEIAMQLHLNHLKQVLVSAVNVNGDTMVRLRKKEGSSLPFLSFIISQPARSLLLNQEIPVSVLSAQNLMHFNEPNLPEGKVNFFMPNLKNVSNVIDRMRNISDHLTIEANTAGRLTFKVEVPAGTITTHYEITYPQNMAIPDDVIATVKVDIKKFSKSLTCHQVDGNHVVCCMVEGSCLVLHVIQNDLTLSYYLPVIY